MIWGYGQEPRFCHACDARVDGEGGGAGLMVWVRGDAIDYEEPPLCETCSAALGVTWLIRCYETEGDDG